MAHSLSTCRAWIGFRLKCRNYRVRASWWGSYTKWSYLCVQVVSVNPSNNWVRVGVEVIHVHGQISACAELNFSDFFMPLPVSFIFYV